MFDENLYRIIDTVTSDMQYLTKNLYGDLSSLRKEIIRSHRIVCLLPYYIYLNDSKIHEHKTQVYLPTIKDLDLIKSLFQTKDILSFPEISMIAQDVSFLINYFESNPIELAREIVNSKNDCEFNYYHLIYQIIPSFFGFFHSFEHLNSASKFYLSVIDIISGNPKNSIRILQPFLNIPATYRYIEYAMTKFFKKISLFKSDSFDNEKIHKRRDENTIKLLHCLSKGVSLLPDQILQIFRLIKTKYDSKWSIKDWYKLVFSIFINPHVTRWARSHFYNMDNGKVPTRPHSSNGQTLSSQTTYSTIPNLYQAPSSMSINSPSRSHSSQIEEINNILSNVLNDKIIDEFSLYIEKLTTTPSSYSPPQMYKCFNDYSTQYYILIKDLITLINLLDSRKALPSFIKLNLIRGIPSEYRNSHFYINVYQSTKQKRNLHVDQPIIIPSVKIDSQIVSSVREKVEYRARIASLESLAESVNKSKIDFVLENSVGDKDFHDFALNHFHIELMNSAEMFEDYIESRRYLNEVEKWLDLSICCKNFLFLAYLNNLQKYPEIFDLLPKKIKLFNQLVLVDEHQFLEKLDKLVNFANEWDAFVHKIDPRKIEQLSEKGQLNELPEIEINKTKFIEKNDFFEQAHQLPLYVVSALSIFTEIPVVNLPRKYELFMEFLDIIDQLFPKDNNCLFLVLIQRIPGSILMKVFIEISIIVMHDETCGNFISNIEKAKWQRFENLIYETASKNNRIFKKILNCQIEFQKNFVAWKNTCIVKRKIFRRNRSLSLIG